MPDKGVNEQNPAPETPESEGQESPKKKGLPKWAILAAVLLVQVAGSYYLQKTLIFGDPATAVEVKPEKQEKGKHAKEKKSETESEHLSTIMIEEIIVNPAETAGRRYLAISVGLLTEAPEAEKLFEDKKPLIRDALISLFSSKYLDQLSSIQYRDTLKEEVKVVVNKQFSDAPVKGVLFTGYVLQ
ncbi:flagellar basal body-associated FliL family protein [bacterium]|nr:flagellar basal body-associated FliL family protein [bacterium]MBU1983819.1 flagellar basal body-associated FliL family protein [bacterium]